MNPRDSSPTYVVVVNAEGRFSVWESGRPLPAGWEATGSPAILAECLSRIDESWADMRPRSLRS